MNLEKIRNMSDDELKKYLSMLGNRDTNNCITCGKTTDKVIRVENLNTQQTKQLCGLCDECYEELLDFLGTYDISWR